MSDLFLFVYKDGFDISSSIFIGISLGRVVVQFKRVR